MTESPPTVENVVILGSGCAGLTAAIYAARANLEPLVVMGVEAGGQLSLTTEVENYPGFPEGIMGPDLMAEMRAQAQHFGAELVQSHVTAVDLSSGLPRVTTADAEYQTRALIIATGASARLLGLPSERTLIVRCLTMFPGGSGRACRRRPTHGRRRACGDWDRGGL